MSKKIAKNIDIIPISEEFIQSFHACLDSVARERIYIGGVKARPIESTREFVQSNIDNNYPQYIAVEGKRVVGWCDIIPLKGIDFAHCGAMGMGLHKDYRRQGLGTGLLESTLGAAKEFGIERVELEVYTSNTRAIRLYEKFGFVHEGVKKKARKLDEIYYDVKVMALFINP